MPSPDEIGTPALTAARPRAPYSVAICTYDGARWVGEQLQTIREARPAPAELALVADASRDETMRIVAQAVDDWDCRSVIEVNRTNVGSLRSFQRALGMTTQPIVFLADQDDAWRPDKSARMLDAFAAREDLLLLHSDARLVDDDRQPIGHTLFEALEATPAERDAIHRGDAFDAFLRRNLATGATMAFRRSLLDAALPFPDDWVHDEWLAIIASAIGRVDFIDEPLIDYRQHASNQIGARKLSLLEKFSKAFDDPSDSYIQQMTRTAALLERLIALGPAVPPDRVARVRQKLAHLRVRAALPAGRLARLVPIAGEWVSGGYRRHSTGMKSLVRDLLHRRKTGTGVRTAIRNVALNLGGLLLPMVVALVAMPVLVHRAGPDRLGFLGLTWTLIGYFALLDLGLSRVVTRRIAIADALGTLANEIRILKRLCMQLFVTVAAISAVLALVVPATAIVGKTADPVIVDEARSALLILWATLPLTIVTGLLRGALEGLQQFGRANVLRAFFGAWSSAAPVAMLAYSNALAPLTLAIAIGRALSLLAHARWALLALKASEAERPGGEPGTGTRPTAEPGLATLFREGGWLTVSNIVSPIMVTFDRFAIAAIVSLAAASYYFVPQEMALRLLVIPAAVATTIFPMLARSGDDRRHHGRIAQSALRAVACACLPLCAAFGAFAEPLLAMWMGNDFAKASRDVGACLMVGLFANCCAQVPFAWIQAAGRSDVTGKLHLLELPLYVVLVSLLTWRLGIVGAAIAWSTRAVVDATLLYIASDMLFGDVDLKPTGTLIACGLALLVGLSLVSLLPTFAMHWQAAMTMLAACLVISGALAWQLHRDIRG